MLAVFWLKLDLKHRLNAFAILALFPAAALRLLEKQRLWWPPRVREDGVAPPLQRRKLQSFGAQMDAETSTEFPRRRLRQQPCAQAAPSSPQAAHAAAPCCSARRSRETRYSAR